MRYFRQQKIYLVYLCLVLFLTACQGSDLGNWVEQAIAPEVITPAPTFPASIDPKPVVLPANFPPNLPQPSGGSLIAVYQDNVSSWRVDRSPEVALTEYRQLLQAQNWQILQQSNQLVTATTQDLFVIAAIDSNSIEPKPQLIISYFPYRPTAESIIPPVPPAPEETVILGYVEDLQKIPSLGISPDLDLASPVTRREYVRWLVRSNNYLFGKRPSRQIRLAKVTEAPIFADVPENDPDFPEIQGLVNSGFLARSAQFRPDQPLTREEMVHLKIPFDLGQLPPPIEFNQLQARWRFQDTDKISAYAQRAIGADAQLGDSANIRRSFGFTSLFQPQRPVSRLEALASLWYFGTPTDGISARSATKS